MSQMEVPTTTATITTRRKPKAYQVLGDYKEFEQKFTATLPPPKAPDPESIDIVDRCEFPSDVWFAATIAPDNGVAVIASYRELCKARGLYQQQLGNIHTSRRQQETMGALGTRATLGRGTVSETIKQGAELRRLDKFEQQQHEWSGVQHSLAARLGRPVQELAMQRGPAWRNRTELTELLHRAQPADVKGASPEVWNMSLRDAWERIIPLGSIFSGLSIVVKEMPDVMPAAREGRVGRPLEPPLQRTAPPPLPPGTLGRPPVGRALSARSRAWEDGDLLAQRLNEYRARIKALQPHDPELTSLKLRGEALESQLEALAMSPVTLAEVEGHLRQANPQAYEAYKTVKDEMEAQLRAALEAEAAAQLAAEQAAAAAAPQPGPILELSDAYMTLACHAGETATATVTLTHRGTAAVRYQWLRQPRPQLPHAPSDAAAPRFFLAQREGVLLPGAVHTFTITFRTPLPGTFCETWRLDTVPTALGAASSLALVLRGFAEQADESGVARAALEASLAEKEKMAKVQAALERILRDVRPRPKPAVAEAPNEAALRVAWDRSTLESHWPPLYHSMELQDELAELYGAAQQALTAALAPPVEEDPKKKKKVETARKKGAEELPPPPPKYPPAWSGSLSTLEELLTELAALQPAAAAPLQSRLDAAKARARVPGTGHKLLQHAMRSLVHKLVDAVAEKLDAVDTDYRSRLAEQQRAEAGEGGDEPTTTAAAPPAPAAAAGGKQHAAADKAAKARQSLSGLSSVSYASVQGPVDQAWFRSQATAATKTIAKAQLGRLNDELTLHRLAVGDYLEVQIQDLDAKIAEAEAAPQRKEQLLWDRFTLLRTWNGLGVPTRPGIL